MRKTALSAAAAGLLIAALAALGAGGGGGGSGGETPKGAQVNSDYRAGLEAVKAKDWKSVVDHMGAVIQHDPKNADAWNYLGHAYRQLGDMDNSFKHYDKALELNPKHRGAHEYIGEAYLQVGNLPEAEEHLEALDKLCFFPCEEYTELKEHIADYKRSHAQ